MTTRPRPRRDGKYDVGICITEEDGEYNAEIVMALVENLAYETVNHREIILTGPTRQAAEERAREWIQERLPQKYDVGCDELDVQLVDIPGFA
ncbi:hypothetical protein ACFL6X_03625 [Candidatus Latescibacterota bacterium]